MAYVGFDDCGYKYFDKGYYLLFSEDNAHEHLFDYVVQDLSCLPELFDQYVSARIDTSTLAFHGSPSDDTALDQIKQVLIAAHPYYKHEIKEVLINAIGDYFNKLLLYSCYRQRTTNPDFSEEWYLKRIRVLMNPLLVMGDTYPKDFYNKYQKQVGGDMYTAGHPAAEIETAIYGVPQEMPKGLSSELQTQSEIYNMLYFLLDISAQGLDELTAPQRIWLYSNITSNSGVRISVPKQISLKPPTLFQAGHDYSQQVEENCELDDNFRPLYALSNLNVGRDGVPADMEESLRSAIDSAKTVTTSKPYEQYEISSLHQLLFLEILSMVQDKVMIRKCRRCGKYFVVANRRIAYCDRVDSSGMRCSAIGSQQSFQKKIESDEPLQAYNRAYKTHHARVRKGIMTKEAFHLWCSEAKQKLNEARVGQLDISIFKEWLKK